jgi:glycosyltransferase involved in cell wall biosynthesis
MSGTARPLRILHILRAPVGGLFRHVIDLAGEQVTAGHQVGIVADSSTGGTRADAVFADLAPKLSLGLTRVPMSRHLGGSDLSAARHVAERAAATGADVIHGHGAKGGAYARLTRRSRAIRVYTPHGGSLHYSAGSPIGLVYLGLERALKARTELFLFESEFGRDAFAAKLGAPQALVRVVHNGVTPAEFEAVAPDADATDLVFVGELRVLKGVDVLIDAIASLTKAGRRITATIVGGGPDADAFRQQVERLGLAAAIRFPGVMPARPAFARGRCVVVPSRAESLPYIVLEAGAAGMPLITTHVGGIPEIFGPQSDRLVPPGDAAALAQAIGTVLDAPEPARNAALTLRDRIRAHFATSVMAESVIDAYRQALAAHASRK